MIPYLTRIDRALEDAGDAAARAALLAERAAYLARCGDIDLARKTIAEVRGHYGDGRHPVVSVATMLAEGVIQYFDNLSDKARDRVWRAHAIARTMDLPYWRPLCAAWFAHFEFHASRYASMASLLTEAVERSRPNWHQVSVRAGLVLADAFQLSGDIVEAKRWYRWVQDCSLKGGDRVGLGALIFNRNAIAIAVARAAAAYSGQAHPKSNGHLLFIDARSSLAYQRATGVSALDHLAYLSIGRALLLAGEFVDSAESLRPLLRSVPEIEDKVAKNLVGADLALALANSGMTEELAAVADQLSALEAGKLDADDSLVYLANGAVALRAAGRQHAASVFEASAEHARTAYLADLDRLRLAIEPLRALPAVPPTD